jgi:hypothetical protein
MARILKFIRPDSSFDPETLPVLGAAYDLAVADLHDTGQPDSVCEIIAGRIVASAMTGEREPTEAAYSPHSPSSVAPHFF